VVQVLQVLQVLQARPVLLVQLLRLRALPRRQLGSWLASWQRR